MAILAQEYSGHFPTPDRFDAYLSIDDCTILEAIKRMRGSNEWARRIYERDHLSEAYVTLPHHTGLESYFIITKLKKRFWEKYGDDPAFAYVDDQARRLPTNPFFGLQQQEEGDKEGEPEKKFASIIVQDKHKPKEYNSIFKLSLSLELLSQKNINIVRFYVTRDKKEEAAAWCSEQFSQIKSEAKKIKEGWS